MYILLHIQRTFPPVLGLLAFTNELKFATRWGVLSFCSENCSSWLFRQLCEQIVVVKFTYFNLFPTTVGEQEVKALTATKTWFTSLHYNTPSLIYYNFPFFKKAYNQTQNSVTRADCFLSMSQLEQSKNGLKPPVGQLLHKLVMHNIKESLVCMILGHTKFISVWNTQGHFCAFSNKKRTSVRWAMGCVALMN